LPLLLRSGLRFHILIYREVEHLRHRCDFAAANIRNDEVVISIPTSSTKIL
jgi:hypothetical protein